MNTIENPLANYDLNSPAFAKARQDAFDMHEGPWRWYQNNWKFLTHGIGPDRWNNADHNAMLRVYDAVRNYDDPKLKVGHLFMMGRYSCQITAIAATRESRTGELHYVFNWYDDQGVCRHGVMACFFADHFTGHPASNQ